MNRIWRVGAAGLVAAAMPLALASSAPAASGLGGWNLSADANVVDITIDNATGLAGVHPFDEADFPAAQSTFQSGPFGSALASVFWPGAAAGNFGALSAELPFPPPLAALFAKTNDPVKASSQYPSGPSSAVYPSGGSNNAIEMRSTANAGGVSATSALGDVSESNFVSFSSAKGTSSATANSKADATSSSDLDGISLLGGLIDVGSVTSTASAISDGNTASGSTVTHITGVSVLGQPASIGSDGLILPSFNKVPVPGGASGLLSTVTGPVIHDLLSETIQALALKVTELPSQQTQKGSSESILSGGLQLQITPPASAVSLLEQIGQALSPLFPSQLAIIPTLPGLLQGSTLTITIGRSTASAAASPPFSNTFTPFVPSTLGGSTVSGAGIPASSVAGTPGRYIPGTYVPGSSASATPTFAGTPGGASVPAGSGSNASLIDLSSPLAAGAVVLGALAAAALGIGLFRLARSLVPEDAGPVCPLGQENP